MSKKRSVSERALLVRGFLAEVEGEFQLLVQGFGEIISSFSIAHWKILMAVWERSGEITQTEAKQIIAKLPKFQSDKARRELIKELASANMIVKTLDPNDERRVILSITDEALPKVERYMTRVGRSITDYADKLAA